jgi:hypothetical protein
MQHSGGFVVKTRASGGQLDLLHRSDHDEGVFQASILACATGRCRAGCPASAESP